MAGGMRRTDYAMLAVAAVALTAGCASGGIPAGDVAQMAMPAAADGLLPAPQDLVRATSADSILSGSEFHAEWPSQHVEATAGEHGSFSPSGGDLAYAIYSIGTPEPAGHYALMLDWAEAGAQFSDQWVGLADVARNRWVWFPMTDSGVLPLPADNHLEADQLTAAVLCQGAEPWELSQLSLGVADTPDQVAPDFTLRLLHSEETITLSSFRAVRPVVLLFGSYT